MSTWMKEGFRRSGKGGETPDHVTNRDMVPVTGSIYRHRRKRFADRRSSYLPAPAAAAGSVLLCVCAVGSALLCVQ
jgi:hypothetical protein